MLRLEDGRDEDNTSPSFCSLFGEFRMAILILELLSKPLFS